MGQYHLIANYSKYEFIHPHKFNDGLKLMEFGANSQATMLGLAVLLAASCKDNARGGGDIHPWVGGEGYEKRKVPGLTKKRGQWLMSNIVGRWAGDRVAIIGDYNEPTDANNTVEKEGSPWDEGSKWNDISEDVVSAIEMDFYTYTDRHSKS